MDKELGDRGDSREIEGRYANYFSVGHNAVEFVLDFGQRYTEEGTAGMHTRIITSPTYAIALLGVLREAVEQYEKSFGSLPAHDA
jgi:hypothetical protein